MDSLGKQLRTLKWRYLDNFGPTVAYRSAAPALAGEAARALAELSRNGIAVTSSRALFGSDSLYEELAAAVVELEQREEARIAKARADAENTESHKGYILNLLGDCPVLDPGDIHVRFALQRPVLEIVNAYFGMYTRLRYFNVWHTFATRAPARDSQLWHRDPEDQYVLKMFVYLSDVDEDAGPFIYAAGSHPKTTLHRKPASFHRKGDARRSDDRQIAAVIPPDRWVQATGGRGTIILADTRGFHKGGLARERDRIMYLCMFTSQASKCGDFFLRTASGSAPPDKERAFALGWRGSRRRAAT